MGLGERGVNATQADDPMLSVREMAELTGLALSTLYHWMERHELPWDFFQVTGTKRVSRRSDVLAWLEAVRIRPRTGRRRKSRVNHRRRRCE